MTTQSELSPPILNLSASNSSLITEEIAIHPNPNPSRSVDEGGVHFSSSSDLNATNDEEAIHSRLRCFCNPLCLCVMRLQIWFTRRFLFCFYDYNDFSMPMLREDYLHSQYAYNFLITFFMFCAVAYATARYQEGQNGIVIYTLFLSVVAALSGLSIALTKHVITRYHPYKNPDSHPWSIGCCCCKRSPQTNDERVEDEPNQESDSVPTSSTTINVEVVRPSSGVAAASVQTAADNIPSTSRVTAAGELAIFSTSAIKSWLNMDEDEAISEKLHLLHDGNSESVGSSLEDKQRLLDTQSVHLLEPSAITSLTIDDQQRCRISQKTPNMNIKVVQQLRDDESLKSAQSSGTLLAKIGSTQSYLSCPAYKESRQAALLNKKYAAGPISESAEAVMEKSALRSHSSIKDYGSCEDFVISL